ncbi:hypothetical protein GCM10009759_03740 [Kitasatospora saccharophila]|uniref:Uncharacterized protein n=1 Tax=Kitasatospora saccharophila TaxID=407973 RepID=A0ABN2W6D8_9ACTN
MNATTGPVLGDQAAATVASTGIPVLLLADHPGPAVITTSTGGDPQCYTTTTATYEDGLRAEVHAPGGPDPEELVRQALPGGKRAVDTWLATPGRVTTGHEVRHDGLVARAGVWQGWTLLTVTADTKGEGRLPALRLVGADSLPTGRVGRPVESAAGPTGNAGRVTL